MGTSTAPPREVRLHCARPRHHHEFHRTNDDTAKKHLDSSTSAATTSNTNVHHDVHLLTSGAVGCAVGTGSLVILQLVNLFPR